MPLLKHLWNFFNSNVGLLLLGFVLTTVIGGFFVDWIQQRTWERQVALEQKRNDYEWERNKKFELLKVKIEEGQDSLEEISELVNLRLFSLQKVFESLAEGDLSSGVKKWSEYAPIVEKWNTKLNIYQNRLERLVDKETALQFNNYETDNLGSNKPTSLHGLFFVAHKRVRSLLECMKKPGCVVSKEMINDAAYALKELDFTSDRFIDTVSQKFIHKTFELEEVGNLKSTDLPPQKTPESGG